MSVYKEPKNNTWRVIYRYTDWKGGAQAEPKAGLSHQAGGAGLGAGAEE